MLEPNETTPFVRCLQAVLGVFSDARRTYELINEVHFEIRHLDTLRVVPAITYITGNHDFIVVVPGLADAVQLVVFFIVSFGLGLVNVHLGVSFGSDRPAWHDRCRP
jgi:hypothetical protein